MCFITGQVHSITPHRFLMSFFVANLLATISQLQESASPISSTATHGLAHGHRHRRLVWRKRQLDLHWEADDKNTDAICDV